MGGSARVNINYPATMSILAFVHETRINLNNITKLNLSRFGSRNLELLLKNFPNLEYLELLNVYFDDQSLPDMIKRRCPKLKGLSLTKGFMRSWPSLINVFGNQLNYLCHGAKSPPNTDFRQIDLSKLQQLRIEFPNIGLINRVLATAKNLEQVHLNPTDSRLNHTSLTHTILTHEQYKSVIIKFLKYESLKYLGAETKDFVSCLDGIELGLFGTKDIKRKELKIRVEAQRTCRVNLSRSMEIMLKINRIIHQLSSSDIDNVMFILDLNKMDYTFRNTLDSNDLLDALRRYIPSNVEVISENFCFVITNKDCSIRGWKEQWLMNILTIMNC